MQTAEDTEDVAEGTTVKDVDTFLENITFDSSFVDMLSDKQRKTGRMYLDPEIRQDRAGLAVIKTIVEEIKANINSFIHGKNTTFSESMHARRLVLTSKTASYQDS
jgi:hypothetical protein